MKKLIVMALVIGVYTMPLSASDVDSDYATPHEYITGPEYHSISEHTPMGQIIDHTNVKTQQLESNSQEYNEDSPWVGTTHRIDIDEFGYDEE